MAATSLVRDGRVISYAEYGLPDGAPVFLMHGTPGSHRGPRPTTAALQSIGVRLIVHDRPGYGASDRLPGRVVAHAAADVADLADALGVERFAVVGRSGGGPHALACAALLPDRVTRAAALVSFAPYDLMGAPWQEGMTESNIREFSSAAAGLDQLDRLLGPIADRIRADPISHLPFELDDLTAPDRVVMSDKSVRTMLVDNFQEGLRKTSAGWVDDSFSFVRPWGFDPAQISVPVRLWHGIQDVYVPIAHTLWLGERISTAETSLVSDAGHFTSITELSHVIRWLSAEMSPSARPAG